MKTWISVIIFGAAALPAQQPAVTTLAPANGTLMEAFPARELNVELAFPRQLHELSDGRVLMTDGMRMLLEDFATGKVEVRSELPGGGALITLPGDSTIINMPAGWYFLSGVRQIGMLPPTNPIVRSLSGLGVVLHDADDKGHVLVSLFPKRAKDSVRAALIDRVTGDTEVVAKLWDDVVPQGTMRAVCVMSEPALLTSDGWVAVLRANPYRVDWRSPSGQWTLGKPIPTPVIPMTQRERDIYLAWRERERPTTEQDEVRSWPTNVCPWVSGHPPIATSDGKIVVFRVPTAEHPDTRYDVVNRQGRVERQIAMPASEAILGFGRKSVYVVTTKNDTQTISRHPWP